MRTLLPLALAACSSGTAADSASKRGPGSGSNAFRVVMLADTHVVGPEYDCCSESEGIDNDSIMKTPARLEAVQAQVNALDPAPDLVFVLGDVVHDALVHDDVETYSDIETGYSTAAALFRGFDMPVHLVWGNHDYDVRCSGESKDRELAHGVFEALFDAPPTESIDHKGWRFVLANSQLGPTWTAGHPLCETGLASYGPEQLAWIDTQLAEGMPTIVMAHFYTLVTKLNEDPGATHPDLPAVLARHDNLKLFLAGHMHRWVDNRAAPNFPQVILGATRYDTDNFWLFEFDVDGDEYRILDEEKPAWYTTCADTWDYNGPHPAPAEDSVEEGDCGN
jgi:3',5'-cyclic AMP phosphodiesterase CpdA